MIQIRVRFWFTSDARARVGNLGLAVPGPLNLPEGSHELDLTFEDGRTITCSFYVERPMTIRYVVERGTGGISIDDGPVQTCWRAGSR